MTSSEILFEVTDLSVSIAETTIIKSVELTLKAGELHGLLGPNGAGKSTLLKAMTGLQEFQVGSILLRNENINTYGSDQRGRAIGYLEQNGYIHWPLKVQRLVELGRVPHLPTWTGLSDKDSESVEKALKQTDTWHLRDRISTTLSGGEKCRVLLARVFAGEPDILFADEPIAALDPAHQLMVMNCFRQFVDAGGTAIIAIHDLNMAARYCDKLLLLDKGEMVARGNPDDVLNEENLKSVYGILA